MKNLLVLLFTFITFAAMAQEHSSPVLTGKIEISEISDPKVYPWFNTNYKEYKPDAKVLENLKNILPSDATFLIFGGTWCSDTHNLLPKFYKVLDAAGITRKSVTLYFLDENKTSPDGLEKEYGVNNLPTFILMQHGTEIGRVVETVNKSIEADLLKILQH